MGKSELEHEIACIIHEMIDGCDDRLCSSDRMKKHREIAKRTVNLALSGDESYPSHWPTLEKRTDGLYGLFCMGCSDENQDYVNPCKKGIGKRWPPDKLVALDDLVPLLALLRWLQEKPDVYDDGPANGGTNPYASVPWPDLVRLEELVDASVAALPAALREMANGR